MRLYRVAPCFSQMTTAASHLVVELFLSHSLLHGVCQQVSTTVTSGSIAFLLLSLVFFPYMFRKIGCFCTGRFVQLSAPLLVLDVLKKMTVTSTRIVEAPILHKSPKRGLYSSNPRCLSGVLPSLSPWTPCGTQPFSTIILMSSTHTWGNRPQTRFTLHSCRVVATFGHYWPWLVLNWNPRDNILVQFYPVQPLILFRGWQLTALPSLTEKSPTPLLTPHVWELLVTHVLLCVILLRGLTKGDFPHFINLS